MASVLSELLWTEMSDIRAQGKHIESRRPGLLVPWVLAVTGILAGCETNPPPKSAARSGTSVAQERFVRHLDAEQCNAFLRPLGLERVRYVPVVQEYNLLWLSGTPEQLNRAKSILDLVDSPEDYCIMNLGPASGAKTLPSRQQLETALGDIRIGTFAEPPAAGAGSHAIIDVQGDSVLAFVPVGHRDRLQTLLDSKHTATDSPPVVQTRTQPEKRVSEKPAQTIVPTPPTEQSQTAKQEIKPTAATAAGTADRERRSEKASVPTPVAAQPATPQASRQPAVSPPSVAKAKAAENPPKAAENRSELPKTVRISFTPAPNGPGGAETATITDKAVPDNGEDLIDMTLPETITVVQLLDLAGKYMGLNCVYDPREITNQSVALKLHGNLQGAMKVKNLYALLETVLGDQGLAMIRQQENLVVITKIDKALQTQPELVDTGTNAVQVGDTVVTRAFNVKHVDILSVITLLQDMKLSVAVTAVEKANLLLVTCHAGRMNRVEQLVEMIDRPGKPIECRFRRLDYTAAAPLIAKIRALSQELEGIVVTAATNTSPAKPAAPTIPVPVAVPRPAQSAAGRSVYLDGDERTNRILMIGYEEELTLIEQLVDTLDVAQADPRSAHIYDVENIDAEQALEKLQTLEVLKTSRGGSGTATTTAASNEHTGDESLTGEPLVSILETTNQLLVRATSDQHVRIAEFLDYIDTAPGSSKILANYELKCIRADTARTMLAELGLAGVEAVASAGVAGPNEPSAPPGKRPSARRATDSLTHKPQVVISESTNALLVNATAEQQEQIGGVIKFIDRKTPEEELSVQIYPVENSSPDHISEMLERLLTETREDKEGKIVEKIAKTEEQITVVPDPNTYSLIVSANQKNQLWIEDLIGKLDKRRPQVLIDVTLVEVTRTDIFEYDLNLVATANDAVAGNIVIDPIQSIDSRSRLEGGFNLMDQEGNPTGQTRAFYSDQKVQALLTAIQRKNYGRVLAKPKVLVDDGQEGEIVTTDETTYVKESIQIPQTGTPITTRDFVPIQASIQLQITPHISEGDLLRLNVNMSRDDFGTRPLSGAPPDKATSKVTTTVFVPDDRTVILGGLVKLNQSKGGSKVPLLGDIPLVGALFRSVDNSDVEKKLYVFLKANIVRPYDESKLEDLQKISDEHRKAFEKSESQFQNMQDVPGIQPAPMPPKRILEDYQ